MRKVALFFCLMIAVVIIMPLFIIRSCGTSSDEFKTETGLKKTIKLKLYVHYENKVGTIYIEDYVVGVLAAEMPANFNIEALKAQAVAARTYALGRINKTYIPDGDKHHGADLCSDPGHCQAWISKKKAFERWGISANSNWAKLKEAVKETEDIVMIYDNKLINPLYHSNSGGRTENVEDVWGGNPVPYLRSVVSKGEENNPEYENTVGFKETDIINKLKKQYPDIKLKKEDLLKQIKINKYSEGGRVETMTIGNKTIKGTEFRALLSLKSTNIKIEEPKSGTIKITTKGNGHGVGMSQWGANYMGQEGYNFEEILKYYYQGISFTTCDKIK